MNVNSDPKAAMRAKSYSILFFRPTLSVPLYLLSPVFLPLFTFLIFLCFSLGLPLFVNDGLVPTAAPTFCKRLKLSVSVFIHDCVCPTIPSIFSLLSIPFNFNSFLTVFCEKDLKTEDVCYGQLISRKVEEKHHST
jgi:hypothetical protein